MNKSCLRKWDIVELRNGERRFVIGESLVSDNGFYSGLDCYDDELNYTGMFSYSLESKSKFDIMKVYTPIWAYTNLDNFLAMLSPDFNIRWDWEREEIKEVTMAEVEAVFGCKVKIVKEEV